MRVLNIVFTLFITISFGWAQNQSDHVIKIKDDYKQPKKEKVNSENQDNSNKEEIKDTELIINKIDVQKTNQKVVPKKVENTNNIKTKEKESFGSAKTSGQKKILEEQAVDEASMNTDAKAKVNKLSKKRIEVKKTD